MQGKVPYNVIQLCRRLAYGSHVVSLDCKMLPGVQVTSRVGFLNLTYSCASEASIAFSAGPYVDCIYMYVVITAIKHLVLH